MLQITANCASPLVTLPIAGKVSKLADVASCLFPEDAAKPTIYTANSDHAFLTMFSAHFPLAQKEEWCFFSISTRILLLIYLELQNQPCTMEQWQQVTTKRHGIG